MRRLFPLLFLILLGCQTTSGTGPVEYSFLFDQATHIHQLLAQKREMEASITIIRHSSIAKRTYRCTDSTQKPG